MTSANLPSSFLLVKLKAAEPTKMGEEEEDSEMRNGEV
jgi:hypothetical protein